MSETENGTSKAGMVKPKRKLTDDERLLNGAYWVLDRALSLAEDAEVVMDDIALRLEEASE